MLSAGGIRCLALITLGGALSVPVAAQPMSARDTTGRVEAVNANAAPCDGPVAVCALLAKFLTAFNERDFDTFRSTFAKDITFFVDRPFPPRRVDGRAAAEGVFAGGFAPYGPTASSPRPPLPPPLIPSRLRVQVFGDAALITFEVIRPTELARRTLVAQRDGNDWRIVHIHASSGDTKP